MPRKKRRKNSKGLGLVRAIRGRGVEIAAPMMTEAAEQESPHEEAREPRHLLAPEWVVGVERQDDYINEASNFGGSEDIPSAGLAKNPSKARSLKLLRSLRGEILTEWDQISDLPVVELSAITPADPEELAEILY